MLEVAMRLGSAVHQSKDVSGAQYSLLLLFNNDSIRTSFPDSDTHQMRR